MVHLSQLKEQNSWNKKDIRDKFFIFGTTCHHQHMDSNFTSRPQKVGSEATDNQHLATLVLHNDDVNTFDYVMETLVEVCDHTMTQAEQCATITHYKGKCEILSGSFKEMKELRYKLISRGLKASVDN